MKRIPFILVIVWCTAMYSCKKSNNSAPANNAFADSLRTECTQMFVGAGDSSNLFLPTAFTPNGDGINDVYRILGKNLYPPEFSSFLMLIYDTTGKLMFKTQDATEPWEGIDSATGKVSTKYKFYVQIIYTMTGNKTGNGFTYVYLLPSNTAGGCVSVNTSDTASYRFEDQFDALMPGFNTSWPSYETYCN